MARIYVASSWRNALQPHIVETLRGAGHEVYDFRNPKPGDKGFGWSQLQFGDWRGWSPADVRLALQHPIAQAGFDNDHQAMEWADTFVRALILQLEQQEPELMYLEADQICVSIDELLAALQSPTPKGDLVPLASQGTTGGQGS